VAEDDLLNIFFVRLSREKYVHHFDAKRQHCARCVSASVALVEITRAAGSWKRSNYGVLRRDVCLVRDGSNPTALWRLAGPATRRTYWTIGIGQVHAWMEWMMRIIHPGWQLTADESPALHLSLSVQASTHHTLTHHTRAVCAIYQ
jgi:hypothetical protein